MFNTVLIANRGECALRIARACRELGIRVVAVHSTADRDSAVTRIADATVQIGPAAARRSYLNAAAILEAARASGADAIHPGYGLLSEDADFAEACRANGMAFVGPPAGVMRRLGDKAEARALMAAVGVPVLPGSDQPVEDAGQAGAIARDIGYPVVLKAVAGGGGRGIQVVRDPGRLAHEYERTRTAALEFFGDDRVYVEKYLDQVRHVEVQVLADEHGTVHSLGERDCSVQRRHQKLIEETPAPGLSSTLTDQICAAAVTGARAAGYVGAGTFEFLVAPSGAFYFVEANCRLQVEHPVTEMVTGVDLVAEQFRIAAGIPLLPGGTPRTGVSVECRINAENPELDFAPSPGVLEEFEPPGGPFVRVDTHGYRGYHVPPAYDSMLAKLVVWGPDRETALARMRRALAEFRISGPGVSTTAGFLAEVLDHPLFQRAEHNTALVGQMLSGREATTFR